MVGSAIARLLRANGYEHIHTRTRAELDLTDQAGVHRFFQEQPIDQVILAAAKVGGIHANNTYPADFIYQNLMIEANVIHGAFRAGVRRLLFLGSSCIYPRQAPQPMREEHLLGGPLEPTNEPYAVAKIAGIKLCESYNRQYGTHYRAVMPTNLYGPNDNFNLESSHVLPALIRKFHLAKLAEQGDRKELERDEAVFGPIPEEVRIQLAGVGQGVSRVRLWGTGAQRREFLHVDDLADASLFVLRLDDEAYAACTGSRCLHLNVGTGEDLTVRELAEAVRALVGFRGDIDWDLEKPDGPPRKLLDVSRLNSLGWRSRIGLEEGIAATYRWYQAQSEALKGGK